MSDFCHPDGIRRFPLKEMQELGAELLARIPAETYHKIEIVGSVRRRKATVKDIEILVEPKIERLQVNMFEEETGIGSGPFGEKSHANNVKLALERMAPDFRPRMNDNGNPSAWGFKLLRGLFHDRPVDVFFVMPDQSWGIKKLIYTGPADFSKKFVTERSKGGFLPVGCTVAEGILWDLGKRRKLETEEEYFEFCGVPFIDPVARETTGIARVER